MKPPRLADYYFDLGLEPDATDRAIRAAYLSSVRKNHPDKLAPGQSIDAVEFRKASPRKHHTPVLLARPFSSLSFSLGQQSIRVAQEQEDSREIRLSIHYTGTSLGGLPSLGSHSTQSQEAERARLRERDKRG